MRSTVLNVECYNLRQPAEHTRRNKTRMEMRRPPLQLEHSWFARQEEHYNKRPRPTCLLLKLHRG